VIDVKILQIDLPPRLGNKTRVKLLELFRDRPHNIHETIDCRIWMRRILFPAVLKAISFKGCTW